jgi:hypothetical protein
MHQGRYGAARLRVELEKLTEKARELRADIARRKKELTRQKKEGAAGISRAKAIAALEKKGALEKLKAQIKSKEAERRAAAKILAGRRRKVAAILKAPGPGIWHENRDRIKALQESFLEGVNPTDKGKQVTWNKKPMPVAEFRQKVARGEINAGLLDKRLTDRVFRRDLNELFDSELDDLLAEIRSLEAEGRAVWQEKEARREHRVKSEIGRLRNGIDLLVEEGKTREARRLIEYMKAKTTEEARKIAESADSPLTKALWETWKDANLFKTMQGGKNEGVMTDLLRKEGNLAKRRKVLEVDRRVSQVLDLAEELKFDINAAKRKKITIEGLGPDGKDQVLSVTELMLMHVGLNNERMRAAVLYGNFLSPEERLAMRNMLGEAAGQDTEVQKAARVKAKQEARRTGEKYRPPKNERRYRKEVGESINRIGENKEALIRKAMAENLTEKEITIARAIADNFSGNFDRVKDVFFNMFNEDVGEQKSYLPINRKSSVGDKTAHQEAAEALNIGTHMVSVSVDEGMMHDRLNIKPWNQTDIELDIFNVFFKGVEREEHFAAFAPYVRNLNAVFKQKNYGAEAMQRRLEIMYGKWAVTRVRDYINILAAPDSIRSDTAENFLDALSGKAAMADIGFNVASYLAQYPQSAAAFLGHINLFEYLGAVKDRMKDRKLFDQMVREKSTVMRRRIINYAQEYVRHMKDSGKFSQAQIKYADMAMKMQEVADWQTVSTGWWAAYKKELKKNGGNETAAILQADEIVLGTQPDMDETELAPIFRGGKGHLPKALVRYGAPLNTVWNQLTYGLPNAVANKTFGNYLSLYASIGMANLLVAFMRGKFSDEDDEAEDWVKKIAYYLLLSPVAESVPVISDATGWLAERAVTGEKIPRLQRKFFPFAESVIKAGVEVKEFALDGENRTEEKFWKTFWDVMEAGAYGTGTPINQARKIREAYNEKTFWPVIGFRKSK